MPTLDYSENDLYAIASLCFGIGGLIMNVFITLNNVSFKRRMQGIFSRIISKPVQELADTEKNALLFRKIFVPQMTTLKSAAGRMLGATFLLSTANVVLLIVATTLHANEYGSGGFYLGFTDGNNPNRQGFYLTALVIACLNFIAWLGQFWYIIAHRNGIVKAIDSSINDLSNGTVTKDEEA